MKGYLFFKHLSDYPSDRQTGWSEELQGVTHDEDNWFITQKNRIWKIPVGGDLNDRIDEADPDRGIITAPIPFALAKNYDHLGDPDYYAGYLFVPVEKMDSNRTARIACFDAESLDYLDSALLPDQKDKAPWCAINPADGLLYSSRDDDVTKLCAYQFSVESNRLRLTLDHQVSLKNDRGGKFKISSVQGGVFTNIDGENHFYLASNADGNRGVHVFRWPQGKRVQKISISDDWGTIGEELEGLTYWDLDSGRAPGIRGQVHVLELDNDANTDDVKCFKHYRVMRSPYVANCNPSCREVHRWDCRWIDLMTQEHKVAYRSLPKALKDGYDGCHYCLGEYDKR